MIRRIATIAAVLCMPGGAAAAPRSGTPSAAPFPASLFLPSARDARPALIAIGSRDGGRPAAATEPAASMSLVRRTCGAGSSASRPRIAPRRAGRWRRWRRPGRGRLRVRRSRRAGDPRPHVAVWVDGPGSAALSNSCATRAPHQLSRGRRRPIRRCTRRGAYSPPFAVRYAAPADTVPGGCDGRDTGAGADSRLLSRSPVRSNR